MFFHPYQSIVVAQRFEAYPPALRQRLVALRSLIFEVAAGTPLAGPLEETLKWGQPAYLTAATGAGTTLRIDADASNGGDHALYVNCKTDLVDRWRDRFPQLRYSGTRAVHLHSAEPMPAAELAQCIAMALTYHRGKRGQK